MKYVITGGAGHISKPLAERLLNAGHEVTVISRNVEHLKVLADKGARTAIGNVEDVDFLKKTFTGADAVYTMVPPNFGVSDWKEYIAQIGKNYAEAISFAGVKQVVNLSSVGAHLENGCGPVSGLFLEEQVLNALQDVAVIHLRPGYFYYNFFNSLQLVKQAGIIGSNFGPDAKLVLADTEDIATAATEELLTIKSPGVKIRYIASDVRNASEVASVLGKAIGKPELPWVKFSDEDSLNGMLQAGLPSEIASNFVEMGGSLATGQMVEDFFKNPQISGKVKLEDFAGSFAAAYNA